MRTLVVGVIILLQSCYCQNQLYRCTFDSDTCGFDDGPSTPKIDMTAPPVPGSQPPTRPLSDVTSILEETTYNKERCDLPYDYPQGNWTMHFCVRTDDVANAVFVCPTTSGGYGICASGLYGFVTTSGDGIYENVFSRNISNAGATTQCLEFYYYLLNDVHSPTITFQWASVSNTLVTNIITQIKPEGENKWYSSRTTFITTPEEYLLQFQFDREASSPAYTFALDEISITEGSCEPTPTDITSDPSTNTNEISSAMSSSSSLDLFNDTTISLPDTTSTSSILPSSSSSTTSHATFGSTSSTLTTVADLSTTTSPKTTPTTTATETTVIISTEPPSDLGLLLGLSLGIGIPVLIALIGGFLCCLKKIRPNKKVNIIHDNNDIPLVSTNNKSQNDIA
ncbi:unnamed protein product [Adineta steineri]|uniref:MAM domain-containing protein n=1 Tax=Adineta steineri TaxID=433720 RepID=A0A818SGN3_9BILA|nr:unnamed protein product [Adineta steineri]CAF3665762.1 unnamed protein product [Adineta steineri]